MNDIKVKKLTEWAKIPERAHSCDAGYDLYGKVISKKVLHNNSVMIEFSTGIALELPNNIVGIIKPRSGLSKEHQTQILAGVIDPGYRGEIKVLVLVPSYKDANIFSEDEPMKIAQIIFLKFETYDFTEVDILTPTSRNEKGFGSSGR